MSKRITQLPALSALDRELLIPVSSGGVTKKMPLSMLLDRETTLYLPDYLPPGGDDYGVAMEAARAAAADGATILIPACKTAPFPWATEVIFDKAVNIVGLGRDYGGASIACPAGVSPMRVAPGTDNVSFANFRLESVGAARTAGSAGIKAIAEALAPGSIGFLNIDNVEAYGFEHGLDLQYCQAAVLRNVKGGGNKKGLYSKRCVNHEIAGGEYAGNTDWGIFIDGDPDDLSDPENPVYNVVKSCGTRITDTKLTNNGSGAEAARLIAQDDPGRNVGNLKIRWNDQFSLKGGIIDVPHEDTLLNVYIDGCSGGGMSANTYVGSNQGGAGVIVQQSANINLSAAQIVGNLYGVRFISSSHCILAMCQIKGSAGYDVWINNEAGAAEGWNQITCNQLTSLNNISIYEQAACHTIALGNICAGSTNLSDPRLGFFNPNYLTGAILDALNLGGAPVGFPFALRSAANRNLIFEDTAGGVRLRAVNDANNATVAFALYAGALGLDTLPTSDPLVDGRLWRSGNDVKVSTG